MNALRRFGLALVLLATAIAPAAAVERITYFLSDVTVERNGDLLVTETIRVQAEGRDIRRGILRDFPTSYRRRDGMRVVVGFEVLSVRRNGASEPYQTESLSNGVRVRIGSASRTLNFGQHEYQIEYRTTRQVGFFKDFDELYWNATGTGWTFAIDVAEARITLPGKVPFIQSALYTGLQGATGKDATITRQEAGLIVFRTTRALPPKAGLTVAAAWQKGIVDAPSDAQLMRYWINDNITFVVAGVGLLLLLVYYLVGWVVVGRDPPRGTIIPLFAPPNGLSAAGTRYLWNMGFDDRTFTSAILDLGVRGRLKLVEKDGDTTLHRRDGGKSLPPPEAGMEAKLFGSRKSLELDNENHAHISSAKDELKEKLAKAYDGLLFNRNRAWAIFGVLGWLAVIVAIGVAMGLTLGGDAVFGVIFGVIFGAPALAVGVAVVLSLRAQGIGLASIVVLLFALVFGVAGVVVMIMQLPNITDLLPVGAAILFAPVVTGAFHVLKAPTREGQRVMDGIDGFRQYLGVAEEDRLQALHPPEKTPELFERFLPYAVALDVENAWAAKFAAVLAAAGVAPHVPTWYSGSQNWRDDPTAFTSRLGNDLTTTIASASTPPGTSGGSDSSFSGSSGGGSSGGGGGGGGGSGW